MWLYFPTAHFFDALSQRRVNVDPFDCLAVQSQQQQFLSYVRRSPAWSVADREGATKAAEVLFQGRNNFKVKNAN